MRIPDDGEHVDPTHSTSFQQLATSLELVVELAAPSGIWLQRKDFKLTECTRDLDWQALAIDDSHNDENKIREEHKVP